MLKILRKIEIHSTVPKVVFGSDLVPRNMVFCWCSRLVMNYSYRVLSSIGTSTFNVLKRIQYNKVYSETHQQAHVQACMSYQVCGVYTECTECTRNVHKCTDPPCQVLLKVCLRTRDGPLTTP